MDLCGPKHPYMEDFRPSLEDWLQLCRDMVERQLTVTTEMISAASVGNPGSELPDKFSQLFERSKLIVTLLEMIVARHQPTVAPETVSAKSISMPLAPNEEYDSEEDDLPDLIRDDDEDEPVDTPEKNTDRFATSEIISASAPGYTSEPLEKNTEQTDAPEEFSLAGLPKNYDESKLCYILENLPDLVHELSDLSHRREFLKGSHGTAPCCSLAESRGSTFGVHYGSPLKDLGAAIREVHLFTSHPPEHRTLPKSLKFDPKKIWGEDFDFDSNRYDDIGDGFVLLPCHSPESHVDARHHGCIVLAVSGACRRSGKPGANSAYAVHCANGSRHNCVGTFEETQHSRERAEVRACIVALKIALFNLNDKVGHPEYCGDEPGLEHGLVQVVIKSDSKYLVDAVTEWLPKWLKTGYTRARKGSAMNADLFKEISRLLYLGFRLGIAISFWQVDKERNQQANDLTKSFLDKNMS